VISEDLIATELERIQYDFEEIDIPVKCLKTLEEFDIGNRKIKLVNGLKIKIPFWLANLLEREKLVEVEENEVLDLLVIEKLAEEEGKNIDLQKINNYIYILMKQTFNEYTEKNITLRYSQKERLEMKLRELMTKRLSKILKIAEKTKNITVKIRNMTPEEKWLYETVSNFVEKWKNMVKASEEETS